MAKFLDKKEQVIDFQLTPYGKHRLSVGQLKPEYYAFFDTGITYDSEYSGFKEVQTKIHERIKTETQFIEGILLFEEAENTVPESEYLEFEPSVYGIKAIGSGKIFKKGSSGYNIGMETAVLSTGYYGDDLDFLAETYDRFTILWNNTSLFDLDITPKKFVPKPNILSFESAIGDARFEGDNTQAAPAWKLLTCQGEITKVEVKDTTKYNFTSASYDNEIKEFNIPQVDVKANYTLEISTPSNILEAEVPSDFVNETRPFADGNTIKLIRNDVMVYAEEMNTELLTENFDIEVFEVINDVGVTTKAGGSLTVGSSAISVGDTVTISDGISTATFEFIAPTAIAVVSTAGNIGVATPTNYFVGGSNKSRYGAILNLISAIRQDGGTPHPEITYANPDESPSTDDLLASVSSGEYPTPVYRGTTAANKLNLASTNRGRCQKGFGAGCYKGTHDLQVSIDPVQITALMDHTFGAGFAINLTNENLTKGDINSTITTNAAAARITTAGFTGGFFTSGVELKRKYFVDSIEQIVDGFMVASTEKKVKNPDITEDSVEYYFNILTDHEVNDKIACSCASAFNRDSYYIDVDFDCVEKDLERIYYDIYGSATSPEICLPPEQGGDSNDPKDLFEDPVSCEDE